MSYTNPYTMTLAPDSIFSFSAQANAAYLQRATVTVGKSEPVSFTGQGEGVTMTTSDGNSSYTGATRGKMFASILFEYSPDGTNFYNATVAQVTTSTQTVTIGTEDGTDNDDNDTLMTVSVQPVS